MHQKPRRCLLLKDRAAEEGETERAVLSAIIVEMGT